MGNEKENIKREYLSGVTPKELSKKYGVSINTLRSWIKRYKWAAEKNGECTEGAPKGAPSVRVQKAGAIKEDIESTQKNGDLNEKQKLFCIYYIRSFNATKAYQKAYGCSYESAGNAGYRMLKNVEIKAEIQRLKENRLNREFLSEDDIFQKYMDIAFADYTDYVEFGTEYVPVIGEHGPIMEKNPKTGKKEPVKTKQSYVRLKEACTVDGTLISEIRQDRNGAVVKLADRMKALQWLSDHMNIATDEQKARIEMLRAKMSNDGQQSAEDKVQRLFEAIGGALDES